MPTFPLVPPDLPLDVRPTARLTRGLFVPLGPWFPAEGRVGLVLWRPEEDPAFAWAPGRLRREGRGWRFEGPETEGWVVLCVGAAALGF